LVSPKLKPPCSAFFFFDPGVDGAVLGLHDESGVLLSANGLLNLSFNESPAGHTDEELPCVRVEVIGDRLGLVFDPSAR